MSTSSSSSSSRRPLPLFRVALIALSIGVAAHADAPSTQYKTFTATTTPIVDRQTSLNWDRTPTDVMTFENASQYCKLTFGGRLPTVKELLTLVDEEPHKEYDNAAGDLVAKTIDQSAFSQEKTPIDQPYWTMTPPTPANATEVWTVSFKDGAMSKADRTLTRRFRCVK